MDTSTNSSSDRQIKLVRIAHVYYTHKDIEKARRFLEDFGLQEVKRVGKSDEDEFGGAAFVVESREDLEYAARTLPHATNIQELSDAPGGGSCVTFRDPIDGFPFYLVHGQTPSGNAIAHSELKFNYPTEKHRARNKFQRFQKAPAPVHKLGHFGMCVTNFSKTYEFYTSRFNFSPSDLVHNNAGKNITAFLHLERGSELVDHHCFFFFEGLKPYVHHSSYETHDFDTQVLGHDWLRHQGYENCWGVGLHIMGSQIFDYWFDPSRFILEHYVDGDLVNNSNPTNHSLASPDNLLHIWGPDLPPTFLQ